MLTTELQNVYFETDKLTMKMQASSDSKGVCYYSNVICKGYWYNKTARGRYDCTAFASLYCCGSPTFNVNGCGCQSSVLLVAQNSSSFSQNLYDSTAVQERNARFSQRPTCVWPLHTSASTCGRARSNHDIKASPDPHGSRWPLYHNRLTVQLERHRQSSCRVPCNSTLICRAPETSMYVLTTQQYVGGASFPRSQK